MDQVEFSEMLLADGLTIIIKPKPSRPPPQPRGKAENKNAAISAQAEGHDLPRNDKAGT